MERADLLIVTISNKGDILNSSEQTLEENIRSASTLSVYSTQIAIINETLTNSGQIPDVFIICEGQIKGLHFISSMREVLYSCERHGAIVSLNADSPGIGMLTEKQYENVSKYLSEYKVIPYIESLPVLIKAEMFERFGMLDESFQSIQGALKDFSLRFNQYGWSTIRGNCWISNESWIREIAEHDKGIIKRRYPYVDKIEEIYYQCAEKATEHFANQFVQEIDDKPSLLFSLYEVPPSFNGTANFALKLLGAFWNDFHEKYEICILIKKNTDEFYGISDSYPRVYYPEAVRDYTFRLAYVASQILCAEHMDIINKCCLKYCVCMLDIISLRSHYLCKNDVGRLGLFRDSIEYADLMLSISRFSRDDIISFFHDEVKNANVRTGFLHLASDKKEPKQGTEEMAGPFKYGDYFIVIGNAYRHKMIEPVLEILKDIEDNFIVVGTKTEGYYRGSKRIYGYVSGWLDRSILDRMLEGSKCIIFPSVYEGFGLTLYDAAVYQKKIIVSDTQINLELKELLGEYSSRVITYRRLDELKTILSGNDFSEKWHGKSVVTRSWQDVAKELDLWIGSMQTEDIDIVRLERRWKYLDRYRVEYSRTVEKKSSEKWEQIIRKCISSFPKAYQLYRKFVTAIDKEHYGSH